ncbi:MAG: hypothetical protein WC750_04725 [Patescibacteria group bacterium]|jgi:hypothetical protein
MEIDDIERLRALERDASKHVRDAERQYVEEHPEGWMVYIWPKSGQEKEDRTYLYPLSHQEYQLPPGFGDRVMITNSGELKVQYWGGWEKDEVFTLKEGEKRITTHYITIIWFREKGDALAFMSKY